MMTLYSGTTCPFSQRCRFVLYEKGMDFQIIDVDMYNKPEDIAVMNPQGKGLRYLTDAWQDEAPTWAPNGRVIQFFRTEQGSGRAGLYQVDLTGRNERRLQTPADASDPAWGPILP